MNPLKQSRMVSCKRQADFAEQLGLSHVAVCNREKHPPDNLSIGKLREWYAACTPQGQDILWGWVASFFGR